MKVDVVDNLVRRAAIVLQNIVIRRTRSRGDFLQDREHLEEVVVGDVCQFGAVVLGDDELAGC